MLLKITKVQVRYQWAVYKIKLFYYQFCSTKHWLRSSPHHYWVLFSGFFLIHMSLEWQLLNVWAWESDVVIWFLLFIACVCSCQNRPLLMMWRMLMRIILKWVHACICIFVFNIAKVLWKVKVNTRLEKIKLFKNSSNKSMLLWSIRRRVF